MNEHDCKTTPNVPNFTIFYHLGLLKTLPKKGGSIFGVCGSDEISGLFGSVLAILGGQFCLNNTWNHCIADMLLPRGFSNNQEEIGTERAVELQYQCGKKVVKQVLWHVVLFCFHFPFLERG